MKPFYKILSAAALALTAFQIRAGIGGDIELFLKLIFLAILSPQFLAIYLILRKKLKAKTNQYALISIVSVAAIFFLSYSILEYIFRIPTGDYTYSSVGRIGDNTFFAIWFATAVLLQIVLWVALFFKKNRGLVVWLSLLSAIYVLVIPVIGMVIKKIF